MNSTETVRHLELLDTRVQLDLSLDDLRMILGCFRSVEYQMQVDDEPYLDEDGLTLKNRLERKYTAVLKEIGMPY